MFLKKWWFILKYFLFWMVVFISFRLLFVILYYSKLNTDGITGILKSFYYALYLDASAACYLLAIPTLLLGLAYITQNYRFIKAINVYSVVFIFLYAFIAIGEDGIYREWGTKLNYQALSHFAHFNEVIRTISTSLLIFFFAASAVLGGIFTFWYWKKIRITELYSGLKYPWVRVILGVIVLLANSLVVFTGIRGGWYPIPISQSVCYYSRNPALNDAAVNPGWNLISNISENFFNLDKNPFEVMPMAEARKIVKDLYKTPVDSTTDVLITQQPNICIIILESWSAQLVGSCGGRKGVTPVFDSLATKGLVFDNMITSAAVSDQGIVAVLSGHPHTYRLYLTHQGEKSKKIDCLNKAFKKKGYGSTFYFGGQLSYGNIRSYLFNADFDIVKEERDFDAALPRSRLGVQDESMLQQFVYSMNSAAEPFFHTLFTLNSHMPYDIPGPRRFDSLPNEGKYASSVNYTDASLGKFFAEARKMPWYKNTLFVLVADHSHNPPNFLQMQSAEYNHIPCLFFGDVLKQKYRGTHISRRVMQADIAATLLAQCGISPSSFPWSRNMLNPYTPEWAFYPVQLGGGFTDKRDWVSFDTHRNSFFLSSTGDSARVKELRKKGEAMQQVLFDEFLRY